MNNTEQILRDSWANIDYFTGGSLQLCIEHPLSWYASYVSMHQRALNILSKYAMAEIEPSKSINTVCNKRKDDKFFISFQLLENTQEDVFVSMCSNLIEYSSVALSEEDAIKRVEKRYKQWRRLMERKNSDILSDEARKGLIGELLYVKAKLEGGCEPRQTLDGWVGPQGAPQDFCYDEMWREIKTTGVASDKVCIHSFEQLGTGNDVGELIVYRIDACAPEHADAFTIRMLIKDVMALLPDDECKDILISKLADVGYIDLEQYDRYFYVYSSFVTYTVNDSFPRITRETTRTEIVKCEYTLSIPTLERWKKG